MIEMKACRRCGKVWKQNQDHDWRKADMTILGGYCCRPCAGKLAARILLSLIAIPVVIALIALLDDWRRGLL